MHERHVTAEEVLGLLLDAQVKERAWELSGENVDVQAWVKAIAAFGRALGTWQASRGPVTREWFVERFGRVYVNCARADIAYWEHDNSVDLIYRSENEPTLELENPTRSDIETLVRVLGGECNGKDA